MIYLDSSALVKLVRREPETDALHDWLAADGEPVVSSSLARTEVLRAVAPHDQRMREKARRVLSGVELMPMTYDLLDQAGVLEVPMRSLDAIHLASALRLRGDLSAFGAYDKRLLAVAADAGLPVVSPGVVG